MPQSDVPGEETSPTQPFPTRPPAFSPQGVTLDDAFDLTPELKAAAQAEMKKYRMGPLYTPPSMEGTIVRPGVWGGANWGGGAFDPETGHALPENGRARRRLPDSEGRTARDGAARGRSRRRVRRTAASPAGFNGTLPFFKPPYAHLVAIDLNEGTIAWRAPFGDMPDLRKELDALGVEGAGEARRAGSARAPSSPRAA